MGVGLRDEHGATIVLDVHPLMEIERQGVRSLDATRQVAPGMIGDPRPAAKGAVDMQP
jgi:hypothetical protein